MFHFFQSMLFKQNTFQYKIRRTTEMHTYGSKLTVFLSQPHIPVEPFQNQLKCDSCSVDRSPFKQKTSEFANVSPFCLYLPPITDFPFVRSCSQESTLFNYIWFE